ncbi:MAG: nucleotidyl transferase AbiEii/AbiGii toxin family protein [Candidatus Altiarchaeota archaeon]|nr:nucleotidyl transferase AbiEii/AbiGii toxin family protein [Candidatus Altiarchaeota archaeon]
MESHRKYDVESMIKINRTIIRNWADELGTDDLILAEQDFRLVNLLKAIYSDPFLMSRLYLKGGTAINKLYLRKTPRLSVDIDFNAIGGKEQVLGERKQVRERIEVKLKEQDSTYKIKRKKTYELTSIRARYIPVFGGARYLKIDISNVERFPVLKPRQIELDGINFNTYQLEELTATKLRALHSRLKGRDVYDLYFISNIDMDMELLRKLVIYYFYRAGKIFNPRLFFRNIREKFSSEKYVDDVSGFVRPDIEFSIDDAVEKVLSHYSSLGRLDERDENFIALSRKLLGKSVSKNRLRIISEIKYPLSYLFGPDVVISDDAKGMGVEDIKVFIRRS